MTSKTGDSPLVENCGSSLPENNFYRKYSTKIYPAIKKVPGIGLLRRKLRERQLGKVENDFHGEPVTDFDWNILVILDGCRLDSFNSALDMNVNGRITMGSGSPEFIQETFSEGDWSDTVIVTSNPFYSESNFEDLSGRKREDVFHTVFPVFRSDWDQSLSTVKAQSMVERFDTARKLFPEKRFILHFMQPHYPFIGEVELEGSGWSRDIGADELTAWEQAEIGRVNHSTVVDAYESNIRYVWESVEDVLEMLREGEECLITSDHGNLMGERGVYGHETGLSLLGLRLVPSLQITGDDIE